MATRQLADLGARVIKIERPDGGDFARGYDTAVNGQSSYFVWLNRTKQSVTLDLKHKDAAAVLAALLGRADVFVQNLAPGAAARIGTAPETLRAAYPRLIVCDISGYGAPGPYAHKKAYDMLVQAEAGLTSITGTDAAPSKAGISVADIAAGMYAYSGILAALIARQTSGTGARVDVSLFDALAEWMSAPMYYATGTGAAPPRSGDAHATIAPYERFTAADGVDIYLAIQNGREWRRFCKLVLDDDALAEDPRFATNPARVEHRQALHARIQRTLSTMLNETVTAALDAAEIAWARANSLTELAHHPQLEARGRWRTVPTPSGPAWSLLPPATIEGVTPRVEAVPSLGQHTDRILTECGFSAGAIAAWRAERMI